MRHKFWCNVVHSKYFWQNSLASPVWKTLSFSNIVNCLLMIFVNCFINFVNICIGNASWRTIKMFVIFNRCSAIFETFKTFVDLGTIAYHRKLVSAFSVSPLSFLKFKTEFKTNSLNSKISHISNHETSQI